MPFKKLHSDIQEKLESLDIQTPTPFQSRSIPIIKSGVNTYCIAPKDSGKTSTMVWTTLQKLKCEADGNAPRAVILVENKERAMELYETFLAYTKYNSLRVYVGHEQLHIDVQKSDVDFYAFSAHKMYGPKGVGALYVRRKNPRVKVTAQLDGGGHERGMRSGTLPTHQIVGMGAAFKLGAEVLADESARITALRKRLWDGVSDMQEVYLNGSEHQHVPGIINISFAYVEGESLIMALRDLAVSSGSACTSASLEPSYVLRALGLNDEMAHSSIRFSIGRYTSEQDVDDAITKVRHAVEKLRELSPLWDMFQDGVDLDQVEWAAH